MFVEGVARISSAVFVHANGLGSAFQVAIHSPDVVLVDPRRSGRGEVQGERRVFGQPVPDGGGLVGGRST